LIPLDASLVRGSHGRIASQPEDGPLLITSQPQLLRSGSLGATDVMGVLWDHLTAD
jgi:hypothetical protein